MRLAIAGGGTGGHIFPAVAVAKAVQARDPAAAMLFVGTEGRMDAGLLAGAGGPAGPSWAFRAIRVRGLKGEGLRRRVEALGLLPMAIGRSARILAEFRPDVVLGMGGYASGPFVLAAVLRRVPTLIQEQNAYPGLTNRVLGRLVRRVALGFPEAAPFFPSRRVQVTGNPVRLELLDGDRDRAKRELGLEADRFTLLVFGGSQGAHRINLTLLDALRDLEDLRGRLQFLHATGDRDLALIRTAYEIRGHLAVVRAFFTNMAAAYAAADLVISRAGASTVAELLALGKPAILVPFPYAANDHQRLNAEAVAGRGAGRLILDREVDGPRLAETIRRALAQPEELAAMGERAKALGRPDAAEGIADLIYDVASRASPLARGPQG